MTPSRANSSPATASERLVLIPATLKNSTTGYKNVTFNRGNKKFQARVQDAGKCVHLGSFATAEEAAIAYARSEYGRADAAKLLQPRPAPTAAGAEAILQAAREGLTLATSSSSSSGYKGVTFCPKRKGSKKYQLQATVGGKNITLGMFATAEQAALFYARREAGRDTSDLTAPPPPPPPAPSSAAGAEAVRRAKREGLTLAASGSSNSGYRGVVFCPKRQGINKYQLRVRVGGKQNFRGRFATAEEAALARARHLWDTTVRLLEPQPQQAPPQGAAGPSEASSVEEEDGFDPADIAAAVANSLLPAPPSASEQRAARRQARAAEQAWAAAQAAAGAAPPCDDEVEAEAEQESDNEEESEMEVEAATARVAPAPAAEEPPQCAICLDDLSAHPEARLQPRDPNGWGATHCCKSLFHYRCLHTWLNDDSEVETSCGMEPINTACPGCRGFVSKSKSRMLA